MVLQAIQSIDDTLNARDPTARALMSDHQWAKYSETVNGGLTAVAGVVLMMLVFVVLGRVSGNKRSGKPLRLPTLNKIPTGPQKQHKDQ